jgi:peptidoglycan/LPS O-acetylase OafA/YrhL
LTAHPNELRYEDYLADDHRPAFDGLRAVGFLLVVTAHIPSVPLFGYLQGWAAVWVFFVISGYLLAMLMLREEKRRGRVAYGAFLVKRFCRIVPGYWAAILIYFFACWTLPALDAYSSFMARLPYYLAFLPEYADKGDFSIFTHSWTVGVELKFYLFLPLLVFILLRSSNWRLGVVAMVTALLTVIGSFIAQSYCAILFGVMLALTMERPRGFAIVATLTRAPVAVPLLLVIALLGILHYREELTAVAVVATYLVGYVIVRPAAVLPLLGWKPLVYLGQRSYGAYLLHFLFIRLGYVAFGSDDAVSGLLAACVCLVLTIPAAELLFQAVERPAISYGRRLLNRKNSLAIS